MRVDRTWIETRVSVLFREPLSGRAFGGLAFYLQKEPPPPGEEA